MYWVGMNTAPEAHADALAEFNDFYTRVHLPEVVANNPGFVRGTRYELLEPDRRGESHAGPRWLAIYEMDGEPAAQAYAQRNDDPSAARPPYTPRPPAWLEAQPVWRMIWRRISERGAASQPPDSIFMVGMNVPADTDATELAAFNDFYTNVHVPEVMQWGGYARGSRFELYREFLHPRPGSPRFCAIYEADAATTQANQRYAATRQPPRGSLSSGPPTWEKHETLWQLVYRRLPS
jgi:hypothetical protein